MRMPCSADGISSSPTAGTPRLSNVIQRLPLRSVQSRSRLRISIICGRGGSFARSHVRIRRHCALGGGDRYARHLSARAQTNASRSAWASPDMMESLFEPSKSFIVARIFIVRVVSPLQKTINPPDELAARTAACI
jgi:hypothetical protein